MKKEDWISPAFQKYVSMVAVQDLLKRIRKPDILLLRPLWAPLGVLSGTEELFVFIPPQHESVYVVGGVFQTILAQHPDAFGKAHTRQPIVLRHDNIPRLHPADQRKVHAVSALVEYERLRTFPLDLVRGIYKAPCLARACWTQPKPVVLHRADAGFAFFKTLFQHSAGVRSHHGP